MDSGTWIKQQMEESFIKPSDLERLSRSIADAKGNSDFYVSHATLADIEAGSTPSIHKIFSLAVCLKMPYERLLIVFGVEAKEALTYGTSGKALRKEPQVVDLRAPGFRFHLQFDSRLDPNRTTLLHPDMVQVGPLPASSLDQGLASQRFRYGLIGLKDSSMGDVIPPGSVVEIDKQQNTVLVFPWRTLRERPIYFIWHQEGYSCCWCQQDSGELTLIPHPASRQSIRRFKTPRDASIIGRVVNAWFSFQSLPAPA